jgi:hypothetical protein
LGIGVTVTVFSAGPAERFVPVGPSDFRAYLPRFAGENLKNQKPENTGADQPPSSSAAQVAIAGVARDQHIVRWSRPAAQPVERVTVLDLALAPET